jgi:hypothetical protein
VAAVWAANVVDGVGNANAVAAVLVIVETSGVEIFGCHSVQRLKQSAQNLNLKIMNNNLF